MGRWLGITGRHSGINSDGDLQKDIDVAADEMMRHALRGRAGCGHSVRRSGTAGNSRCRGAALRRDRSARRIGQSRKQYLGWNDLFDPPARQRHRLSPSSSPARRSCAAGFVVYGPQTTLVLALEQRRRYLHSRPARPGVPADRARRQDCARARRNSRSTHRTGGTGTGRFAPISTNASPAPTATAAPISTCAGSARWSLNRFRILVRGGVFLYPADARPGYREGRLRLLYEAHPMALVMEWAGGSATTGRRRILELSARTPHQRVPLIMGSARGVRDVARDSRGHRADVRQ